MSIGDEPTSIFPTFKARPQPQHQPQPAYEATKPHMMDVSLRPGETKIIHQGPTRVTALIPEKTQMSKLGRVIGASIMILGFVLLVVTLVKAIILVATL